MAAELDLERALVIGVASSALFDLEESDAVFFPWFLAGAVGARDAATASSIVLRGEDADVHASS